MSRNRPWFRRGVSRNGAVIKHLQSILGLEIETGPLAHLYGALGVPCSPSSMHKGLYRACKGLRKEMPALTQAAAGLGFAAKGCRGGRRGFRLNLVEPPKPRAQFSALELRLSEYPDFDAAQSYEYQPRYSNCVPVEVDIYEVLQRQRRYQITLGIDIGSTSTKAVLLDTESRKVLAGFYTRTSGKPIAAVKGIFEAVEEAAAGSGALFEFSGAATTGSGRKFIGSRISADLVLDEIRPRPRRL